MGSALRKLAVGAVAQYPVARRGKHLGKFYYLDFALPKHRLAIECDGHAYHSTCRQKLADRRRQREIEAMGWRFLRFSGSQIVTDLEGCLQELHALLKG